MRILVCHEKHYNRYFAIHDDKELHDVCVKILKERLKEKYYDPTMYMENPKDKLGMSLKDIKNLPKGIIRDEAEKKYQEWQKEVEEWDKMTKFKERVKTVIEKSYPGDQSPRGLKLEAFGLLELRKHDEYERIELEDTSN
jgi:dsDNA-binding SOS-regulon protein